MNQILATQNTKKSNKTSEIKSIIRFFAISIMLFGLVLSGEGCYAIYKNIENLKPENIPTVSIKRMNDEIILNVQHNTQIMKIKYSWDNGEENVIPISDNFAEERITLLGYNSTLNLTIEDINGKQISYQKQFILDGVDITQPKIEITTSNGSNKMIITAIDETAISSMSYNWEGEDEVTIYAETENQKELKREVTLTPGTRIIKVIATDANGNTQELEKEIITSTSKPEIAVFKNKNELTFEIKDKDGIKDVLINLNGETYGATDINLKYIKVGPLTLREGNNIISVEVTNVSGYTESAATELEYNPQ